MSGHAEKLVVKSHVARDLLHNAAHFKHDHLVVWEYVSNGLQYVDPGVTPEVRVRLQPKKRRLSIQDNGTGMSLADLQNFFVMHGENRDRKRGKQGRGRFGTGKAAAFGIANRLVVTTVRDGKRSKVSLDREDIDRVSDGGEIPVRILEREVETGEPNGTLVEVEQIHLKTLHKREIIRSVEQHISRWVGDVTVFVDGQQCEFDPPVAVDHYEIEAPEHLRGVLGNVTLSLKVAGSTLEREQRGVAVYANGFWLQNTLAGCEGKEMAGFIFGEIDVPALDDDSAPIQAFDVGRSGELNPSNPVVQALMPFLGSEIEKLRKRLVEQERDRKRSEEQKRLQKQADEIAKVINEDFSDFRRQLAKVRARTGHGEDTGAAKDGGGADPDVLLPGDELPAVPTDGTGFPGADGDGGGRGGDSRELEGLDAGEPDDQKKAQPAGDEGKKKKPRGGFSIEFRHVGVIADRALYSAEARVITINLDHPQMDAALGAGGTEDLSFRRLAYEVAFSEYAYALTSELVKQDHYVELDDPIFDLRATLNRVARKAAALYSAQD